MNKIRLVLNMIFLLCFIKFVFSNECLKLIGKIYYFDLQQIELPYERTSFLDPIYVGGSLYCRFTFSPTVNDTLILCENIYHAALPIFKSSCIKTSMHDIYTFNSSYEYKNDTINEKYMINIIIDIDNPLKSKFKVELDSKQNADNTVNEDLLPDPKLHELPTTYSQDSDCGDKSIVKNRVSHDLAESVQWKSHTLLKRAKILPNEDKELDASIAQGGLDDKLSTSSLDSKLQDLSISDTQSSHCVHKEDDNDTRTKKVRGLTRSISSLSGRAKNLDSIHYQRKISSLSIGAKIHESSELPTVVANGMQVLRESIFQPQLDDQLIKVKDLLYGVPSSEKVTRDEIVKFINSIEHGVLIPISNRPGSYGIIYIQELIKISSLEQIKGNTIPDNIYRFTKLKGKVMFDNLSYDIQKAFLINNELELTFVNKASGKLITIAMRVKDFIDKEFTLTYKSLQVTQGFQ